VIRAHGPCSNVIHRCSVAAVASPISGCAPTDNIEHCFRCRSALSVLGTVTATARPITTTGSCSSFAADHPNIHARQRTTTTPTTIIIIIIIITIFHTTGGGDKIPVHVQPTTDGNPIRKIIVFLL